MNWKPLAFLAGLGGAGMLIYGALVESNRLVVGQYDIGLSGWPEWLDGFRVVVLGDFHLRDKYSFDLASRAIDLALAQEPDMIALVGDYVAYWKSESPEMLADLLAPLLLMQGDVAAVPGNHDYWQGDASFLEPVFTECGIRMLRNEAWVHKGIRWVGIDSYIEREADPLMALTDPGGVSNGSEPTVALWHEPDYIDLAPGADLALSGHTHGGQFRFPGGFTPMHTKGGRKYVRGFYPDAPTPIFVTRGVGTTGPPSRFNCPPEIAVLTIRTSVD